jgi:DNA-binding NarL/FixJ family response regulator
MKTLKSNDGQIVEILTRREQQIAEHVARGLTNRQIGAECGISPETVKRHLASIYSKLATRGRVGLAVHVLRMRGALETSHRHDSPGVVGGSSPASTMNQPLT